VHNEIIIEDVAIYLRKSRGETEKDLDKHSDALIEICNDKGWKYEIYKEIVSGDTIEMRPIIQQLLEDVEDDLYDAVMVIDQDRLSRGGTADSESIKETLVNSKTYLLNKMSSFMTLKAFWQGKNTN
jgi:DNA invertase Pin-like site-specific DNA recombinase